MVWERKEGKERKRRDGKGKKEREEVDKGVFFLFSSKTCSVTPYYRTKRRKYCSFVTLTVHALYFYNIFYFQNYINNPIFANPQQRASCLLNYKSFPE